MNKSDHAIILTILKILSNRYKLGFKINIKFEIRFLNCDQKMNTNSDLINVYKYVCR